jgi:phosphoglycolate phosphatase-like HAD superfamily hydrolase
MPSLAFDLDGTIITCENRQMAVLRAALSSYQVRFVDLTAAWEAKRKGASTIEALVDLGLNRSMAEKVGRAWKSMIEDLTWLTLDTCYVDSRSTLDYVRDKGFQTILLTARCQPHWVKLQLTQLDLFTRFDAIEVVCPFRSHERKAQILGRIKPEAFFGDTESDFRSAQLADVPFYAVARGQRSVSFLESSGISHVWGSLSEALTFFLENRKVDMGVNER